jgi:hypothetical protein
LFNSKINYVFSTLARNLKDIKKSVNDYFKFLIKIREINGEGSYSVILLDDFIKSLEDLFGHSFDNQDIYCIFTKLKYLDKYKEIDVDKLIEILKDYGIDEINAEKNDFLLIIEAIKSYLYENNLKIYQFLEIEQDFISINIYDF